MTYAEAYKTWYNSKTKKVIIDDSNDYIRLSPVNCYEELIAELTNDGTWMKEPYL